MNPPKISLILSTYRSEKFLQQWLQSIERQTMWSDIELLVIANDPSVEESDLFARFTKKWQDKVIIQKVQRESLYASWNRGIANSKASILGIANVDDLRVPNSLAVQYELLNSDPASTFCYGPYRVVNSFPSQSGKRVDVLPFDCMVFRQGMFLGPFFLWRKTSLSLAAFFDEQFKSGGDFDFAIRLTLLGKGVKADQELGFYLDMGEGLSTGNELQPIERTVIEMRYGIWDKLDLRYMSKALDYRIRELKFPNAWVPIRKIIPDYDEVFQQNNLSKIRSASIRFLLMTGKSGRLIALHRKMETHAAQFIRTLRAKGRS